MESHAFEKSIAVITERLFMESKLRDSIALHTVRGQLIGL